jgi:hypothetical protein
MTQFVFRTRPLMSVPAVECSNAVENLTSFGSCVCLVGITRQSGVRVAQDCRSNLDKDALQTATEVNRTMKCGNNLDYKLTAISV